jgi:hypothetical protein
LEEEAVTETTGKKDFMETQDPAAVRAGMKTETGEKTASSGGILPGRLAGDMRKQRTELLRILSPQRLPR